MGVGASVAQVGESHLHQPRSAGPPAPELRAGAAGWWDQGRSWGQVPWHDPAVMLAFVAGEEAPPPVLAAWPVGPASAEGGVVAVVVDHWSV